MKVRVSVNAVRPEVVRATKQTIFWVQLNAKRRRALDADSILFREKAVLRLIQEGLTPAEISVVTTLSRSCVDDIIRSLVRRAERRVLDYLIEGESHVSSRQ